MAKRDSAVVTAAVALFAVGLLAVVVLFLMPVFDHGVTAPTWVYLLTPLAPIGLVVGIVGVVLANRSEDG